jgi:hypothetical protein
LEARVDALREAHLALLKYVCRRGYLFKLRCVSDTARRITTVYETESYDYPVQIQESISELSTSIGYGITNFASTNLKGTNLPAPAPVTLPAQQHKTLPHALGRSATSAAAALQATPAGADDKLGKALGLYAEGWEKIASARGSYHIVLCCCACAHPLAQCTMTLLFAAASCTPGSRLSPPQSM